MKEREPWWGKRENIPLVLGVFLAVFVIVIMPAIHYEFHPEYLLLIAALCGVSISQRGDK